jgi:hypothetical protein
VNEIKNSLVVTVKITSDLSGRLRSHLLDHVEQFLKLKGMFAENRALLKMRYGSTVKASWRAS